MLRWTSLIGVVAAVVVIDAQQQAFRSTNRTVALYVTVYDKEGRLVPDLSRKDFQILEDDKPTDITTFSNDVVPITVAAMLDMSNSMTNEYVRVRQSAFHFVDALWDNDRAIIGTFGFEVAVSPLLTADKAILRRVIEQEVWPGGHTPLWTALREGMNALPAAQGRRVVLVLTDGLNSCTIGPCASFSEVKQQAARGEFMIYGIGAQTSPISGEIVPLIEDSGGGHFQLKNKADLGKTFVRVVDELHHQYTIGFSPRTLDGRTHDIGVRITKEGLHARARKHYMAEKER